MSKVQLLVDVSGGDIGVIQAILALVNGTDGANGETPAAGRRKRKPAETIEDDVDFETEDETEEITPDVLRKEIKKRAGKAQLLGKLMAKYKVENVTQLKANKYQAFYDDLLKIKA